MERLHDKETSTYEGSEMSESNWYEPHVNKEALDYSKPIITEYSESVYLLSPVYALDSYSILGWNWLNLQTGKYRSCKRWENPQRAIEACEHLSPRNVDLYQLIKDAEK